MTRRACRHGFALNVAVCLLAAVSVIAALATRDVIHGQRSAERTRRLATAASTVDSSIHEALTRWDVDRRDSMAVGDTDTLVSAVGPSAAVYVTRITSAMYWLAGATRLSAGTAAESRSGQSVVLKTLTPVIPTRAVLVARGDVRAEAGATVDGADVAPPGWDDCPPPQPTPAPSVVVPPGRSATYDSGADIANSLADSAIVAAAESDLFGAVDRRRLSDRATIVLPAGAILSPDLDSDSLCHSDRSPMSGVSLGDPRRSAPVSRCQRFHPVVTANGDMTVTGGGQGLLLVRGRLELRAPFIFAGVILADGEIVVTGSPISIYGALISRGPGLVALPDGAVLRRSTCAVTTALAAARRIYPIPLRAWSALH